MVKSIRQLILTFVYLILIALSAHSSAASSNTKVELSTKERLVLMPIRVPEEDNNLTGAMETALVRGLQQKYDVFSGERVAQKAHEIFMKESRNSSRKECDETRCMQNIAEAFQSELIAVANVTKQDGNYFLAISIQNIFDNKVVYSESLPCEKCSTVQVVDKLKILSNTSLGTQPSPEEAEAQKAAEIKIKSEQLKQEQAAFEEKLRKADAAEKKRLLDAKAQDDKHLAELKAQAESRRKANTDKNSTKFPTVETAVAEISRLNESIKFIETGYENELAQTRKNVTERYASLLDGISKYVKDEFETTAEFKARKEKQHTELISQRDAELSRLNAEDISANETAPQRKSIKEISEHEYTIGAESIAMIIGLYDADNQQFNVTLKSKTTAFNLNIDGSIILPREAAKVFKQQWLVGLVHPEAKLKPLGSVQNLKLINDADNTQFFYVDNEFMPESKIAERKIAREKQKHDLIIKSYFPPMEIVKDEDNRDYLLYSSTEITQSNWNAVVNSTIQSTCPNCPVELSWEEMQDYLYKLNSLTSSNFRLPNQEELTYIRKKETAVDIYHYNWIDCNFCVGHFAMQALNEPTLTKNNKETWKCRFHIVRKPS